MKMFVHLITRYQHLIYNFQVSLNLEMQIGMRQLQKNILAIVLLEVETLVITKVAH